MLAVVNEPGGPVKRYRYSRADFRRNLLIAAALTGMICVVLWLMLGIYGSPNMNLYTAIAGLLFFAFISARMIARYVRNEIVLAVQPTGLFDARISPEPISWERIKELVLSRRENEFVLRLHLWPERPSSAGNGGSWQQSAAGKVELVDLAGLDADIDTILSAIGEYRQIRVEY